jgi:hypothetical protein
MYGGGHGGTRLTQAWARPRPPLGVVAGRPEASALGRALNHQAPGRFNVIAYPSESAARGAILDRTVDAAITPGPRVPVLLVATAVSPSLTVAIVKNVHAAALSAHTLVRVQNVRPLPPSDPDSLSQVYFVIALMTPSLLFG